MRDVEEHMICGDCDQCDRCPTICHADGFCEQDKSQQDCEDGTCGESHCIRCQSGGLD